MCFKAIPARSAFTTMAEDVRDRIIGLNKRVVELVDHGRYREALTPALESLELARGFQGGATQEFTTSLNNLAAVYYQLGDYGRAKTLYGQALDAEEAIVQLFTDMAGIERLAGALFREQGRRVADPTLRAIFATFVTDELRHAADVAQSSADHAWTVWSKGLDKLLAALRSPGSDADRLERLAEAALADGRSAGSQLGLELLEIADRMRR